MRARAVAIVLLSLSIAGLAGAQAQQHPDTPAPVAQRQLTPADIGGADRTRSEESGLAKVIEQENERLGRLLKSICRGC